ncbi:hypothetical protein HJFPF1_08085 [Paramyrothecium foliicola]|nr:hypothetical protein HJFPF1_08085 [Paramyrothecium foliicola]
MPRGFRGARRGFPRRSVRFDTGEGYLKPVRCPYIKSNLITAMGSMPKSVKEPNSMACPRRSIPTQCCEPLLGNRHAQWMHDSKFQRPPLQEEAEEWVDATMPTPPPNCWDSIFLPNGFLGQSSLGNWLQSSTRLD